MIANEFEPATPKPSVPPTAAPAGHSDSSPWVMGGLALLMTATLAACGGGGDDPPAAAPEPPAATPAPPAGTPAPPPGTPAPPPGTPAPASTVPAGMVAGPALANGGLLYFKDANANAILEAGERAVIYSPTTQHYYEFQSAPAPLTWDAATAAAVARGGHLFTGDAAGEVEFVRSSFSFAAGTPAPAYGGLQITESDGSLGAWIGLAAAPGPSPTASDGVWSWVKTDGTVGGTALAAGAPWLTHFTFSNPNGDDSTGALRAAMTGGNDLAGDNSPGVAPDPSPQQCIFDLQATQAVPSRYIVEFESTAAVTSVVP